MNFIYRIFAIIIGGIPKLCLAYTKDNLNKIIIIITTIIIIIVVVTV